MTSKASRLPGLMSAYQLYLVDGDSACFIKSIASRYSLATLHRLAVDETAMVRRAAVLGLSHIGDRSSIEVVGPLLSDSDRRVRMVADDAFKSLWYRTVEPRGRILLDRLLTLIESDLVNEAAESADELVAMYPNVPDVYCRRALIRFNLDMMAEAIEDCEACLRISPFHYMAYIGLGQCRLQLDDPRAALEDFRQALAIHPDLEAVRTQLRKLERIIERRA